MALPIWSTRRIFTLKQWTPLCNPDQSLWYVWSFHPIFHASQYVVTHIVHIQMIQFGSENTRAFWGVFLGDYMILDGFLWVYDPVLPRSLWPLATSVSVDLWHTPWSWWPPWWARRVTWAQRCLFGGHKGQVGTTWYNSISMTVCFLVIFWHDMMRLKWYCVCFYILSNHVI